MVDSLTSGPSNYRKRPVVIQAMRWMGGPYECLNTFCGKNWSRADAVEEVGPADREQLVVWNQLENQWLNVPVGHWIIRGIHGEYYSCDPNVFEKTYEPA